MAKKQQAQVDRFNAKHPVGTKVAYYAITNPNRGEPLFAETESEAYLLGGHTPVVWLKGKSGAVALDAIEVVKPKTETKAAQQPASKEVPFDAMLGRMVGDAGGRDVLADILKGENQPTAENLLRRLTAFVAYSDAFAAFASASCLEGTLILPRGRVHFEWDADADGPLFPFIADVIATGEVLPSEGAV